MSCHIQTLFIYIYALLRPNLSIYIYSTVYSGAVCSKYDADRSSFPIKIKKGGINAKPGINSPTDIVIISSFNCRTFQ
jgi:hypothetical protein